MFSPKYSVNVLFCTIFARKFVNNKTLLNLLYFRYLYSLVILSVNYNITYIQNYSSQYCQNN